jgi:hypothetical protein
MRQNVLFSTHNETIQISQIIYAGPVSEIPEENRKFESTHAFKIITRTGVVWCNYNDAETASKVRGALAVMMDQVKKVLYKSHGEVVDPTGIISFSNVCEFKSSTDKNRFGFVISIDCTDEAHRKLWFRYTSAENAEKGRKALFACLMEANGVRREGPPLATENTQSATVKSPSLN